MIAVSTEARSALAQLLSTKEAAGKSMAILGAYDGAVLDRDPGWGGGDRFFVHFGRRRWGC